MYGFCAQLLSLLLHHFLFFTGRHAWTGAENFIVVFSFLFYFD